MLKSSFHYSLLLGFCFLQWGIYAQKVALVENAYGRDRISLNGKWHVIVDPYERGYRENSRYNFPVHKEDKSKFLEHDFESSFQLEVPGDWNSQEPKLFYYEGLVWYKKSFDLLPETDKKYLLYFGASNYKTQVYVNGVLVGENEGGFIPFNFDVTDHLLKGRNHLVVAVNNKRDADYVPSLSTDWWNYGGITRDVSLLVLPQNYLSNYQFKFSDINRSKRNVTANMKFSFSFSSKIEQLELLIPELKFSRKIPLDHNNSGSTEEFSLNNIKLWSPESPNLYDVFLIHNKDTIKDKIGVRKIEVKGTEVLLNGEPIFFKGISIHEESPQKMGRVSSLSEVRVLLNWAKELNCNYVRLAHYPHNELMVREAEKIGLMVWSEIPVYWDINWENEKTYQVAENMLDTMIDRDENRANIVIWSVANETPRNKSRTDFLRGLIDRVRAKDGTRLVSAALHEIDRDKETNTNIIKDDLAQYVDILAINSYCGWYGGTDCDDLKWRSLYNKPMFMSEFGGGSLYGLHGDKSERWTEEFQENIYLEHEKMFENIPFLAGISPWILKDFKTPLRMLPGIQDGWNRKGLISDRGQKKSAYFTLQSFYKNFRTKKKN